MARLYIGNFPYTVTENDLRNLFRDFTVTDLKIITDRESGRSRGFGFVSLANEKQVQDAVAELDGTDVGGRTLRVREAEERQRPTGKREQRGNGKGRRDGYGW